MIHESCVRCFAPIKERPAQLLGPPNQYGECLRQTYCVACYHDLRNFAAPRKAKP